MIMPIAYATGPRTGCRAIRPQDTVHNNSDYTLDEYRRSQQFCRINATSDFKR